MDAPLVVVGTSLAGLRAAESARRAGWSGRILLVGSEHHLPYDRPPLSKAFLAPGPEPELPLYRSTQELDELALELRLGAPATGLDAAARQLVVGDDRIDYAALVIATGATARRLPGEELDGLHVLRTVDDARAVRAAMDAGARTVVVGAGFIGSEVASAARERGLPVVVVEAATQPLVRAVGTQGAPLCAALHRQAGVELRCGVPVEGFSSQDGRVTEVLLADGSSLPADLVVVGAGASPATGWLTDSGLAVDDGVLCDATLATGAPGVWAAGDVARVDLPGHGPTRIEHWTSAAEQGTLAGANAVATLLGGQLKAVASVPYFWSDVYGRKLQMVGFASDDAELVGDPAGPWLLLYRRGDALAGALSLDLPGRIMKLRALLTRGASFDDARALALAKPLAPVA